MVRGRNERAAEGHPGGATTYSSNSPSGTPAWRASPSASLVLRNRHRWQHLDHLLMVRWCTLPLRDTEGMPRMGIPSCVSTPGGRQQKSGTHDTMRVHV